MANLSIEAVFPSVNFVIATLPKIKVACAFLSSHGHIIRELGQKIRSAKKMPPPGFEHLSIRLKRLIIDALTNSATIAR